MTEWKKTFIHKIKGEWRNYVDQIIATKIKEIDNLEYYISTITNSKRGLKHTYSKRIEPKISELITLIDKELGE